VSAKAEEIKDKAKTVAKVTAAEAQVRLDT